MFRNIFEHIDNISIFPIFTMILFMVIFIGVIIYAVKMDKKTVDYISSLPMNKDDISKSNNGEI